MTENSTPVAPVFLTLMLCERIIHDAISGQHSLIGLVSNINAPRFPVQTPSLAIFTELTGCHGVVGMTFRIVDVNEERPPVCQIDLQGQMDDPLAVAQFAFGVPSMVFPQEGDYRVQAVVSGVAELEKRLMVRMVAPREPQGD